ncbi:MAG TPA: transposase [Pseudonocardiaceae bacterium]|nr:transposase [Pseudonocardiaceae bacterium]
MERIAGRFARSEPRRRAGKFVRGLLADLPRKNCWTIAEWAGEATPDGMQHLLERAKWDADAVRDCFSPRPVPLPALVRVAGTRWRVEETFQAGKGLAGLDEHQVRRHTPWLRWVTLAMVAHAFLAVNRADEHREHPAPAGLIPLTCNEIQRLFALPAAYPNDQRDHRLRWSLWRRRHQARARDCH